MSIFWDRKAFPISATITEDNTSTHTDYIFEHNDIFVNDINSIDQNALTSLERYKDNPNIRGFVKEALTTYIKTAHEIISGIDTETPSVDLSPIENRLSTIEVEMSMLSVYVDNLEKRTQYLTEQLHKPVEGI